MKRFLIITALGLMLSATTGCHIAECWRYAWNSRFHPERNAALCAEPCVVADPCADSCAPGGAMPVMTPAAVAPR